MSGYPYFPLYWRDWLTGRSTRLMTPEQKGAFVDLLCHAWDSSPPCTLPDDDVALAKLSGLGSRWRKVGGPVRECFKPAGEGLLRNEKMWEVYLDMVARSERRRAAGAKGNATRNANALRTQCDSQTPRKRLANASLAVAVAVAEKEKPPLVPPSAAGAASKPKGKAAPKDKGTRLPPTTEPNATHRRLAVEAGVDLDAEIPKFRDYHEAKGTLSRSWDATLRTWLRNAKEFRRTPKFAGTEAQVGREREEAETASRRSASSTLQRIQQQANEVDSMRRDIERVDAWSKANEERAADLWREVAEDVAGNAMVLPKLREGVARVEYRRRVLALLDSEAA